MGGREIGMTSGKPARSEALTRSKAVRRVCHVFTNTSSMAGLLCYRLRCQPAIRRRPVESSLISGSTAYRKIPQGCQRGHLSVLRPRAQWKFISAVLMRLPAVSPSSLRRASGPVRKHQQPPRFLPGQRLGSLAVDSRSHQKMQGDEV